MLALVKSLIHMQEQAPPELTGALSMWDFDRAKADGPRRSLHRPKADMFTLALHFDRLLIAS
jgi:hypothetical protein